MPFDADRRLVSMASVIPALLMVQVGLVADQSVPVPGWPGRTAPAEVFSTDRPTVEELYARYEQADSLFRGARLGPYNVPFRGAFTGMFSTEIRKYFLDSEVHREQILTVLKQCDGLAFDEFYRYVTANIDTLQTLGFAGNFVVIHPSDRRHRVLAKCSGVEKLIRAMPE